MNSIAVVKILLHRARWCTRSEVSGISRLLGAAKLQAAPGANSQRYTTPLRAVSLNSGGSKSIYNPLIHKSAVAATAAAL